LRYSIRPPFIHILLVFLVFALVVLLTGFLSGRRV